VTGEKREKTLLSKGEGKRPFFPEDIINVDIRFHFGLLLHFVIASVAKQFQATYDNEIATPLGLDTPLRGTRPAGLAMTS
jgi:hypothetical protein